MASLFTHPAVPLALGIGLGSRIIAPRLLFAGVIASMIPDADTLAFKLGIPYVSSFGHRGFTHSLLFALLLSLLALACVKWLKTSRIKAFWFVFISTISHAMLDALTNGGLGVEIFWPFDHHRFFFPYHPIAVSPIGSAFFSQRGLHVFQSELWWVWLPCVILAVLLIVFRRILKIK